MKNTIEINNSLRDIYAKLYPNLKKELESINSILEKDGEESEQATNPLLLKVNEEYVNADTKIMFFGQETNYWLGEQNDGVFLGKIDPVIELYDEFYLKGGCYSYGGQFWNGVNRLKNLISEKFPDRKFGYLWNNVAKIGKCGKGFAHKINHITNEHFNVILQEINIVKPDIVIFLSGPDYDGELKKIFGDYQETKLGDFNIRQLCKINSPKLNLAFRTYHPNYLWRNDIDNYFNTIIDKIK